MFRRCFLTGLIVLLLGCTLLAHLTTAQDAGRLFLQTGYVVRDPFLSFWEQGGIEVFGYPISPELQEQNPDDGQTYTVQYFERARLELHPEASQGVQLGRLGIEQLPAQQPKVASLAAVPDDCVHFAETRQMLCGSFAAFWRDHGGVAIFGYPITPTITHVASDGSAVEIQYTERARFERTPGDTTAVRLGLLGREHYQPSQAAQTLSVTLSPQVTRIVDMINQQRTAAGLAPLNVSLELMAAAQAHSQDMATTGLISHTASDGRSAPQRMIDAGYHWLRCGENIAVGQTSPDQAFDFWLNSPPHRANMLDPGLQEIGVGYVRQDGGYGYYWTIDLGER